MMNPILRSRLFSGALAMLLASPLVSESGQAAQASAGEVMTAPVGVIGLSIPGGNLQMLSFPLKATPAYTGEVTQVAARGIATAGAAWAADTLAPFETHPHIIRITSGISKGRHFRITLQSGNTLRFDTKENYASLLAVGDRYEIVALDTLEDVFGGVEEQLIRDVTSSLADNVLICERNLWTTYYHNGTHWQKEGAPNASMNRKAILPDQGIFFLRRGSEPLSLQLSGEVPVDRQVSELPADTTVVLANPFPIDRTLNDLGLHLDGSWKSHQDASLADCVQIYLQQHGWKTFFHTGSFWVEVGGQGQQVNPVVPKGSAVVVVRRKGTGIVHAQEPPY